MSALCRLFLLVAVLIATMLPIAMSPAATLQAATLQPATLLPVTLQTAMPAVLYPKAVLWATAIAIAVLPSALRLSKAG